MNGNTCCFASLEALATAARKLDDTCCDCEDAGDEKGCTCCDQSLALVVQAMRLHLDCLDGACSARAAARTAKPQP